MVIATTFNSFDSSYLILIPKVEGLILKLVRS